MKICRKRKFTVLNRLFLVSIENVWKKRQNLGVLLVIHDFCDNAEQDVTKIYLESVNK